MKIYLFFLTEKEAQDDPTKIGWAYANKHRSEWYNNDNLEDKLFTGFSVGCNFVVYKDKAYWFKKQYLIAEENAILYICVESTQGCDTRKF